ncbi:hypothetical protein Tco_1099940 [Tanacetum coccineum]
MKVNLTAPTLTFPGIEEHVPYTTVDEPRMGLIYLNSKDKKRVMYLEEIVKFCDATLEKVLNEVKLRMFESKFLKKPPLLVMDPNSSLGKICLGENVIVISSDKVEGSGDWNSPEFQDTANSGQNKKTKAMVFYQMDTEEVSDRFVAPYYINENKYQLSLFIRK